MRATRDQGPIDREASTSALPLAGRRVLLVEDEALVALDLEMTLEAAGAVVVGPYLRLSEATRAAEAVSVDAAVLDLFLGRDRSDALARTLWGKGIVVVFHTAHTGLAHLGERYPGAGHCPKPCTPAAIVAALVRTIEG